MLSKLIYPITFFLSVFDAESLVRYGGLLLVCLTVYAQVGLFFCFFVPSGVFMFTAGVFAAAGVLHTPVIVVCILLILAAQLGNLTGYWFGKKTGPMLYNRKDSKLFKQQYLRAAQIFYEKYGGTALMFGLFFPIVRTFAPIVAGMVKMDLKKFLLYTFIGSACWILGFVLAGYFMARMPFLKPFLKYIVAGVIIFVTIPLVTRIIKQLKQGGQQDL
jgi:membrane-associated protein